MALCGIVSGLFPLHSDKCLLIWSFEGSSALKTTDPFARNSRGTILHPLHSQKFFVSVGTNDLLSMLVEFFMPVSNAATALWSVSITEADVVEVRECVI